MWVESLFQPGGSFQTKHRFYAPSKRLYLQCATAHGIHTITVRTRDPTQDFDVGGKDYTTGPTLPLFFFKQQNNVYCTQ